MRKIAKYIVSVAGFLFIISTLSANPVLTPGTWLNISPPVDLVNHFGIPSISIDPSHPSILYACVDMQGIWKSTNAGQDWAVLGFGTAGFGYTNTTIDSPIHVDVDPNNSKHMYCTQGVRGTATGFWVTWDGGSTWIIPPGFRTTATGIGTRDCTTLAIDPTDFNHILVGTHTGWNGFGVGGVLESRDGGTNWLVHNPVPQFDSGSMGINFLYEPSLGIGNNHTWLVGTSGNGLWRTTDSGTNFTRATPVGWPDFDINHGGNNICYSKAGALYTGLFVYPARSTDNGLTWTMLSTFPYSSYCTVGGDGNFLYTARTCACSPTAGMNDSYYVSQDADGVNWTKYQGGAQIFDNGPFELKFDKVNRIMYSAQWDTGVWALRVIDSNMQIIAVTNVSTVPAFVTNNINRTVVFSVKTKTTNGSVTNVSVNLSTVGGSAVTKMTNINGATLYRYGYTVPAGTAMGMKTLQISVKGSKGGIDMMHTFKLDVRPYYTGIVVTNLAIAPSQASNNRNTVVVFNAEAKDMNGSITNVSLNLSSLSGPSLAKMTNISGATNWRYSYIVPSGLSVGSKTIQLLAVDNAGNIDSSKSFQLQVFKPVSSAKITGILVTPQTVNNDVQYTSVVSLKAWATNVGIACVYLNLASMGGALVPMTNSLGTSNWQYTVTVAQGTPLGDYMFPIICVDTVGLTNSSSSAVLTVGTPMTNISKLGKIIATVTNPAGGGNHNIEVIRDGDMPPVGNSDSLRQYDTFDNNALPYDEYIGYTFSSNLTFGRLVFQEGKHFTDGGWFANDSLRVQARQSGVWVTVASNPNPAYPYGDTQAVFGQSYETYTFNLTGIVGDGIRIYGNAGGNNHFISCGELQIWIPKTTGLPAITMSQILSVPSVLTNNLARIVVFSLKAVSSAGTVTNVTLNLASVGGPAAVKMTNISGATLFRYAYTVPAGQGIGLKTIPITARDSTGNLGSGSNASVTVVSASDITPPTVPGLVSPLDGFSTTNRNVTLSWSVSTDTQSGVSNYRIALDGMTNIRTSTSLATGALGLGVHSWSVCAMDRALNRSAFSAPRTFTILTNSGTPDTTPPTVPGLISPANGSTTTNLSLIMSWSNSIDLQSGVSNYRIVLDGLTNIRTTASYATGILPYGTHTWSVCAMDRAMNRSAFSAARTFTIQTNPDTTPPTVPGLIGPANGYSTTNRSLTLSWSNSIDLQSGVSNYWVVFDGVTNKVTAPSLGLGTLTLGLHSWTVFAMDRKFNRSAFSALRAFTILSNVPQAGTGLDRNTFTITPNPVYLSGPKFNSPMVITYNADTGTQVVFEIYTIMGEKVCELKDKNGDMRVEWSGMTAGNHEVTSGIYLVLMRVDGVMKGKPAKVGVVR